MFAALELLAAMFAALGLLPTMFAALGLLPAALLLALPMAVPSAPTAAAASAFARFAVLAVPLLAAALEKPRLRLLRGRRLLGLHISRRLFALATWLLPFRSPEIAPLAVTFLVGAAAPAIAVTLALTLVLRLLPAFQARPLPALLLAVAFPLLAVALVPPAAPRSAVALRSAIALRSRSRCGGAAAGCCAVASAGGAVSEGLRFSQPKSLPMMDSPSTGAAAAGSTGAGAGAAAGAGMGAGCCGVMPRTAASGRGAAGSANPTAAFCSSVGCSTRS